MTANRPIRAALAAITLTGALAIVAGPAAAATDCDPRLADAILYTEDSKESHRVWVDYLAAHPDLDTTPGELVSAQNDIEWQREMVRRYDVVLDVLLDSCDDVDELTIPWEQSNVPWRSEVSGELLTIDGGPSGLDHRVGDAAPDRRQYLGYRLVLRDSLRYDPR